MTKGFSGDIGDSEIAFTEAENRENINTGESVKTVFGKIKKFFADLTAPAFAQMITSKDDLLATKATGYVPDAKAVADAVTDVNGKLSGLKFASISTSVTLLVTNRQSLLGSLSDFGLPSNANVFGVFVNCNWAVNVRLAINGNFYAYQIATVSNDATFTLNFVVAYK